MDQTSKDGLSPIANPIVRKLLGRAFLHEDRFTEALHVFINILQEKPDDCDTLLILGNLYRAAGWEEPHPLLPEAVRRLLIHLTPAGTLPGGLANARQAADFLLTPGHTSSLSEWNELQPEELKLMPALVELNIRRAQARGQVETAEALRSLQIILASQAGGQSR